MKKWRETWRLVLDVFTFGGKTHDVAVRALSDQMAAVNRVKKESLTGARVLDEIIRKDTLNVS